MANKRKGRKRTPNFWKPKLPARGIPSKNPMGGVLIIPDDKEMEWLKLQKKLRGMESWARSSRGR